MPVLFVNLTATYDAVILYKLGFNCKLLRFLSNVPSKSLLSVRGMKGCVSSGEYYPRQGSFGFLSQNEGAP